MERSYAKVNIYLKVTGTRGNYHEISSRFMRLASLYDEIEIVQKSIRNHNLDLEGAFSCRLEENTMYKAYQALKKTSPNYQHIEQFYNNNKLCVKKNIPEFGGFGGGSSNVATFLKLTNEKCRLGLNLEELCNIGVGISADSPFFLHEIDSANISGIGEVVKPFDENVVNLEFKTTQIKCNTRLVYEHYRQNFLQEKLPEGEIDTLRSMRSTDILDKMSPYDANDLYPSVLALYPEMKSCVDNSWFLTGAGSTLFRKDLDDAH